MSALAATLPGTGPVHLFDDVAERQYRAAPAGRPRAAGVSMGAKVLNSVASLPRNVEDVLSPSWLDRLRNPEQFSPALSC